MATNILDTPIDMTKLDTATIFKNLRELSLKAEWDNLPKNILEKIGFSKFHTGVVVSLSFDAEFYFLFSLSNFCEQADEYSLSIKEVDELLNENK